MKKEGMKRGIAVLLTIGILIILLLAGPAQAVILGLAIENSNVKKGETIYFQASAEVESGEHLDVSYFTLKLIGPQTDPQTIECTFDVNGNVISGCIGMTITKDSSPPTNGYGYGYYVAGKFIFNITLNTADYSTGKYQTFLAIFVDNSQYKEEEEGFVMITPPGPVPQLGGCSIRANDGAVLVGGEDSFKRPNINFHVPLGNANNGKGTFSGQVDRSRISYKFDILNVIENDNTHAKIIVKGTLEVNGSIKEKNKEATIYYDKINKEIDLTATTGMNINAENMKITFQKWC